jgi:hypothetical protein
MTDICAEIDLLIPGYALDALDSEEREKVLEHLHACPRCEEVLADYLVVRQGLLLAPPGIRPPAGLRRSLAASVRPATRDGSSTARFGFGIPAWAGMGLLGLLLAVNLFAVGKTSQVIRGQEASLDQLAAEQARLAEDLQTNQTAMALGTYPTSEVVRVQGEHAYGTFVYDPDLKIAVLYAWGLDPLPADKTYQAWLIDGAGRRTSAGLFQAAEGARFTIYIMSGSAPLSDYRSLGVTIEPVGGSPGPTGLRVLAADF